MGYTHYFSNKETLPQDKWDNFIKEVKAVKKSLPKYCTTADNTDETPDNEIHLTGCGRFKNATFNKDLVWFNGGDGNGRQEKSSEGEKYWECDVNHGLDHETFSITRKGKESFNFCKTARKPYDFMVCAVLTLYAKHFGAEAANVSSDGCWDDWSPAVKLVEKTVGLGGLKISISTEDRYTRWAFTDVVAFSSVEGANNKYAELTA